MTRPKIKTALMSVFILIAVVVCTFAAYAVNRLSMLNHHVEEVATDWLPSTQYSKEMDVALADLRAAYRDHILALDETQEAEATRAITAQHDRFVKEVGKYEALVSEDNEKRMIKDIRDKLARYENLGNEMITLSMKHDNEGAKRILQSDMKPLAAQIIDLVRQIVEINRAGAEEARAESQSAFEQTLLITIIAIIGCIAVIGGSIWFAFAGVARPIEQITSAMKKLAAGDIESAIPYAGRTDEIGDMAAAVDVFRTNAVANLRLEREADAQRNQSDEERRRNAEAERIRADAMAQATSGLAEGLKHLAGGNLNYQLVDVFAPDFESLRADFNAAVKQLNETLSAVTQSTSSIDSGSREISQSAEDLSKRTEQQAASLEETAAALDQITVNVSNSSKRADEARSVAVKATASAAHSGAVVANAVDAMQRIEQSSNQIANIIGVIDEIAFQTNLLALNAGVEAARAGDAGKGFAVVAQEVRELAQRSASAAREIKDLIRNSSAEVENGVKLVSDTGEALKTIESYIVSVNQHMDSIATSAREQSVGLAEVNTAVNQMDQVTQQNAAMVEETNAASANLATESGRLRSLISQFQLVDSQASSHAATLRHAASAMASAPREEQRSNRVAFHGNAAVKVQEWSEF